MSTRLEEICRQAASGIHACKAFPGGGLAFTRRGFEARVEFTRGRMDVMFDTRDLAVEAVYVAPAGMLHDLKNMVGIQDCQIGEPEFDGRFEVRTSSPEFARKVLSPGLRPLLRAACLFGTFFWRLSPAGFLLRMKGLPKTREDLDRWLMLAFQLLDALPGADGKGRVQLGVAVTRLEKDTSCQICGVSLSEGAVVRCAKCSTPHHKDCWEFNGRCSTFACGEARFR